MMHNEKDKQSKGHTECYKRSNERSQMITSDFESKVSSMKDVLLDVALKELINIINCQWLKIIQIEITGKKTMYKSRKTSSTFRKWCTHQLRHQVKSLRIG